MWERESGVEEGKFRHKWVSFVGWGCPCMWVGKVHAFGGKDRERKREREGGGFNADPSWDAGQLKFQEAEIRAFLFLILDLSVQSFKRAPSLIFDLSALLLIWLVVKASPTIFKLIGTFFVYDNGMATWNIPPILILNIKTCFLHWDQWIENRGEGVSFS